MNGRFDLVIFDCDGVLVDSERLSVRLETEVLAELGWPLSESEVVERFVGRTEAHMHAEVERHLGRPVDWELEFAPRYREVFTSELVAVEGITEALDAIAVPTCVASSGTHERMALTLGLTGLAERFSGRVFSATEVARGKPAPDIFLYAAERVGADPGRCAVVEDSASGVRAALAAGMTVFAFAGGVTPATAFEGTAAVVFYEMRDLPGLLDPA